MNSHQFQQIKTAILYIETHLGEKLDLDRVAQAAGYSKYHLHHLFTGAVGITPCHYIQRRQLTQAAELLVRSRQPVVEIALGAGYESHQAFTAAFKSMYKQPPAEYRRKGIFYPLQLALTLKADLPAPGTALPEIVCAALEDLPGWMDFTALVIDGFPCLDQTFYREQVTRHIQKGEALILRHGSAIIGAAAFSHQTGNIDFLAAHPQYRRRGAAKTLLDFITRDLLPGREISVTTFRAGDRADTGQRAEYQRLGFTEAELLTEFGYPTQRLILSPKREADCHG